MDDLMPIGEFSELSGLSPKRLRSYAASGLLIPAAVDAASGYRYYAPGQQHEAMLVAALRSAGMPVAEIATLLRDPSLERLDSWARRDEMDATQRRDALEEARHLLPVDPRSSTVTVNRESGDTTMTTLRSSTRTDIGRVRQNNEDAVLSRDQLVAVADGMGGSPGGALASSLALALVETAYTGRSLDELRAGARAANGAIFDRANADADFEGMGTTVCAAGMMDDGRLAVVNVGDSRAYLLRDGTIRQLTDDHSITADLVRRGELTEEEAVHHPDRSILTRVLGAGPTVEVDGSAHSVLPGDRLLLCTDGLFNEIREEEIGSVMERTEQLEATAEALVERALAEGGRDNVTIAVAEIGT